MLNIAKAHCLIWPVSDSTISHCLGFGILKSCCRPRNLLAYVHAQEYLVSSFSCLCYCFNTIIKRPKRVRTLQSWFCSGEFAQKNVLINLHSCHRVTVPCYGSEGPVEGTSASWIWRLGSALCRVHIGFVRKSCAALLVMMSGWH